MAGRTIPVADTAVASAALEEIAAIYDDAQVGVDGTSFPEFLLQCASKVKFQPSTRQLVLTFDLGMSGGEREPGGTGGVPGD